MPLLHGLRPDILPTRSTMKYFTLSAARAKFQMKSGPDANPTPVLGPGLGSSGLYLVTDVSTTHIYWKRPQPKPTEPDASPQDE